MTSMRSYTLHNLSVVRNESDWFSSRFRGTGLFQDRIANISQLSKMMSTIAFEQKRGRDTDVVAGEVDGEDDDQDDVVENHDHLEHRIRAEHFAAVDGHSCIESGQ